MFSRKLPRYFITAAVALGLASCAKTGEAPPSPQQYTLSSTTCLTDSVQIAGKFAEGSATDHEIGGAWDCFGGAFTAFSRYIQGSSSNSYTADELGTFIAQNFLPLGPDGQPKYTFSPTLKQEFMKIKQIFVGGSREVLTKQEVATLVSKISALKDLCVRINPYMKLFVIKWQPSQAGGSDADVDFFEKGNATIQSVAKDFSSLLRSDHEPYRLDDAVVFLNELSKFSDTPWNSVNELRQFLPVIKKVKHALTDEPEDAVFPDEWRTMLLLGARGYVQYLRYYYFLKGSSTEVSGLRVKYFASTFEDTFSIFEDLVSNKPSGVVDRPEIIGILDALTEAWPTFHYSDVLVDQFMNIKVVLFGGNTTSFNVVDFRKARLKMPALTALVYQFLPYYAVYSGDWKPETLSHDDALKLYQQAHDALDNAAQAFGGLLESPYDMNNLNLFLAELERLYPPPDDVNRIDITVAKYMGTLIQVKNTIYEDQGSVIKVEQWPTFLGFANRIFTGYMFYSYFLKDKSDLDPVKYDSWSRMADLTFRFAGDLVNMKTQKKLTIDEIQGILIQLQGAGLIPAGMNATDMKKITQAVVQRVLVSPDRRLGGYLADGVNADSLTYLRGELDIWIQDELFLVNGFHQSDDTRVSAHDMQVAISVASNDPLAPLPLLNGLTELWIPATSPVPFANTKDGSVLLVAGSQSPFDFESMQNHNWVRSLVRVFLNSYVSDLSRIKNKTGISQDEAQVAYGDFRSLAVALDIINPDDTQFMISRFRDATIFMPHSMAGTYASFGEVHDLIYALFSGLKLADVESKTLKDMCKTNIVNTKVVVAQSCLFKAATQDIHNSFYSLPQLQKYMLHMSADASAAYLKDALTASGASEIGTNVEQIDVGLLPQVLQYVELMYARFDANGDGIINTAEARKAYPSFEPILKKYAAGAVSDSDLLALFMWFLKEGKPPSSWLQDIGFLWFKINPSSWNIQADRGMLVKILAYIGSQPDQKGAVMPHDTDQLPSQPGAPAPTPVQPSPPPHKHHHKAA